MGPPAYLLPVDPFLFLHIKIPCYSISEITFNKTRSLKELFSLSVSGFILQ